MSEAIELKVAIHAVESGYQAVMKANTSPEEVKSDIHASGVALFNDDINPFVQTMRNQALKTGKEFKVHYKNFVKDRDLYALSGDKATNEELRI